MGHWRFGLLPLSELQVVVDERLRGFADQNSVDEALEVSSRCASVAGDEASAGEPLGGEEGEQKGAASHRREAQGRSGIAQDAATSQHHRV